MNVSGWPLLLRWLTLPLLLSPSLASPFFLPVRAILDILVILVILFILFILAFLVLLVLPQHLLSLFFQSTSCLECTLSDRNRCVIPPWLWYVHA